MLKLRNRILEHIQQIPVAVSENENGDQGESLQVKATKDMALVDLLSKKFQLEVKKNVVSDLRRQ